MESQFEGRSSGPRAGFWRRFAAALLDGILIGIPAGIIQVGIGKGGGSAIGIVLAIAYFTFFEGSASGQTVGKRALGIRVLDFGHGGAIGYPRAFVRYLGRYVSFLALLLGYLWMLWDKERQCWHDKFANDVVVPTSAYPVERWPG